VDLDSGLERAGLLFVGADDEDGVIAGDSADNFGPVLVVDRRGDGLGAAGGRDEDEKIGGEADFEAEAAEDLADAGAFVFAIRGIIWQSVAERPLHQAKFVYISRKCRLCDMKAVAGELAAQFVLVGDGGADQEFADCGMTLLLHDEVDSGPAGCDFMTSLGLLVSAD
jgi:hypothetical protein